MLSLPKLETGTGIYAPFLQRVPAYLCENHVMAFMRLDPLLTFIKLFGYGRI